MRVFILLLLIPLALACHSDCQEQAGYSSDQCDYYQNDWLPPKYAQATYCVCTNPELNTLTYQCIRRQLQLLHDSLISDTIKSEAEIMASYLKAGTITMDAYDVWADLTFGSIVSDIHHQAYDNCCCLSPPLNKFWWHSIFFAPMTPCSLLRTGQKFLSDCGCNTNKVLIETKHHLSTGAIVGIVLASLTVATAVVLICCCLPNCWLNNLYRRIRGIPRYTSV